MGSPGFLWARHLWASLALVEPLGPCGPGPCGLPWALVGQALMGSYGPLWAEPLWAPLGPCGPPCALVGQALVSPPKCVHTYMYGCIYAYEYPCACVHLHVHIHTLHWLPRVLGSWLCLQATLGLFRAILRYSGPWALTQTPYSFKARRVGARND